MCEKTAAEDHLSDNLRLISFADKYFSHSVSDKSLGLSLRNGSLKIMSAFQGNDCDYLRRNSLVFT